MNKYLIHIIEEQITVGFTGRINILDKFSKQLLGHILIDEGILTHIAYNKAKGFKALVSLVIDENIDKPLDFIVEPEMIEDAERSIHFPFSNLKEKLTKALAEFKEIKDKRPPNGIKILLNPEILSSEEEIDDVEFSLMCTISDVNKIEEIYTNSPLLEYEITKCLVTLRKKNALKVVGTK